MAAAGNDGVDTDVTGNYPSGLQPSPDIILAVASSTINEQLSSFSNFGATSVDIAAPGSDIISTIPTSFGDFMSYGSYGYLSGTSMATPLVAGVAAVAKKMNRALMGVDIKAILIDNADAFSAYEGKMVSGTVRQHRN